MIENEKKSPDKKKITKEIEKMMQDKFGQDIQVIAESFDFDSEIPELKDEELEIEEKHKFDLNFEYTPKEIKSFLDKYVIKQDEAKKALAIAVCDHYNHVRECHEISNNSEITIDDDNYSKQNVLMLGPTGVGKTYLIRTIARLIGVPFVKADATRFTEMGYVGANVDDLVRDLVHIAHGDVSLAQYGIIYFDEADKIAGQKDSQGKDISGRGVQNSLLKLMEETEIDLKSAHDIASQMQAFMDIQKTGKISKKVINTKHILFIVSGAFSGLENIINKRLKTRTIGLGSQKKKNNEMIEKDIFSCAITQDFISYGLEPEFIGRLPIRLSCQELSADDLYHILKDSKGTIINQYIRSFKAYGIDINFEDKALKLISEMAYKEKTGARALMTVCEKILREFKFELPSRDVKNFVVSKSLVKNPMKELKSLLKNSK